MKRLAALSQENSRRWFLNNKLKTIEELLRTDDNNSFERSLQYLFKESILLDELKYELVMARDEERGPSADQVGWCNLDDEITNEELYKEWL